MKNANTKFNLEQVKSKGGEKMKIVYLMMGLLFCSIFAGSFVMADKDGAVDSSELETEKIESSEIQEVIKDVEILEDHKKIGFVTMRRGNGWIENSEEGKLIDGFWAVQKFVEVDTEDTEVKEINVVRARGILRIAGVGAYTLIRVSEDTEDSETISFYLIPRSNKYSDKEESIKNSVGKLSLTKKVEYNGLIVWNGELSLDEGNAQGTWNVEIATDVKRVKPKNVVAIQNMGKDGKAPFWRRIQFWRGQANDGEFQNPQANALQGQEMRANRINNQKVQFAE